MEAFTIQKFIHTSPRKLRLVADMVRKQHPVKASTLLKFTPRAAALELDHAITAAIANAKIKGLNLEAVSFKSIEINEGPKMRRFRAGTKGRVRPFKRKMSHIKIVLTDDYTGKSGRANKIRQSVKEKVGDSVTEKVTEIVEESTQPVEEATVSAPIEKAKKVVKPKVVKSAAKAASAKSSGEPKKEKK